MLRRDGREVRGCGGRAVEVGAVGLRRAYYNLRSIATRSIVARTTWGWGSSSHVSESPVGAAGNQERQERQEQQWSSQSQSCWS